ncbi:hypothetical protein FE257_001105 [Aspergillus nanangensis]|uniref:AB hydrolase-1 domain-containing protein n=1 Tax=Aspergillus nanangensis TaxID=2582783 RepID=A0AAD4CUJ4_ASPNN|nr:hypothetical protein FE257_001105 [Aspergillus nanangensis]
MPSSPIPLTQTFHHRTATHSYQIHWTSLGNPTHPPLVFIHGTPWSSSVWSTYAQTLSNYFHVYLFDNPGFGASPLGQPLPGKEHMISRASALDGSLAHQTEAFAALYKSWAQEWRQNAHVIAHDHGGLMSLRAHLLHGCDYASLCLVNVVAMGPFGQPLFKLVAENEGVFEALNGEVFEGVVEGYIRQAACQPLDRETMEMLKRRWVSTEEGRRGFVRQMAQANSRSTEEVEGRYAEVGGKMPVRVIWGKEDKWIPVETAERLREKLRADKVVLIEGAGHLVMYDQEGKLGVELGWWLNQIDIPVMSSRQNRFKLLQAPGSSCSQLHYAAFIAISILAGRPVIVKTLEISSPSLSKPIKVDTTATALGNVLDKHATIKEGEEYTLSITFEVDQQVNGLTFRQTVKHAGLTVSDIEKPLGDYVPLPNGAVYTVAVHSEKAPSGLLARPGHYTGFCKVTGDNWVNLALPTAGGRVVFNGLTLADLSRRNGGGLVYDAGVVRLPRDSSSEELEKALTMVWPPGTNMTGSVTNNTLDLGVGFYELGPSSPYGWAAGNIYCLLGEVYGEV